jgi:hypothetical protein
MSKDDKEFIGQLDVEKLTQALRDLGRKKALDAAMALGNAQAYDHSAELAEEILTGGAKRGAPSEPKVVVSARARHLRRSKTAGPRPAAVKQPALDVLQGRDGFIHVDEILKQLGWEGDAARKSILNALDQEYRVGHLDKRSPNMYRVVPLAQVQS